MVYKLKICIEDDTYKDLYLDIETIDGFFVPDIEEDEEPNINIIVKGEFIGVKQEPHIVEYLTKRFVEEAVV